MKRIVWFCLILILLGVAYFGLSRAFVPTSAGALVTRGSARNYVVGSVTVSTEAQSTITSPEDGILQDSHLVEGQSVQAGEVVGNLQPGELPYKKQEAADDLAEVESRLNDPRGLPSEILLAIMQKDLADDKVQLDADDFPRADYERLEHQVEQQQVTADHDREELKKDEAVDKDSLADYDDQLRRLAITAPYNGNITSVVAHSGDLMAPGTPIATIISQDLKISAEVNQDDIAAVTANETADVRFFAYSDQTFPARVKLVLPSSDPATQRFTVLLEFTGAKPNLFAGLTGEVSFVAGHHDNVLLVPRRAVFGDNVFVLKDGHAQLRAVKVGFETLTVAEIDSGVSEGETVLTENLDLLRDGDKVRLTNVPAAIKP
jgi:HlyD family secretion protein